MIFEAINLLKNDFFFKSYFQNINNIVFVYFNKDFFWSIKSSSSETEINYPGIEEIFKIIFEKLKRIKSKMIIFIKIMLIWIDNIL